MKTFAFALSLLLVGASAVPSTVHKTQGETERIVDLIVIDLVESLVNWIRDRRLDPVNIESWSGSYKLPVTNLFEAEASVSNVQSAGLSNIVLNDVSFNLLDSRLIFSLSVPRVESSVGSAEGSARLMSLTVSGAVSGSLALSNLDITADVTAGVGILAGVFVDNVDVRLSLGGIESDLSVAINDNDYSDAINNFLGATLPNALADNADEINELLNYIVRRVIESLALTASF